MTKMKRRLFWMTVFLGLNVLVVQTGAQYVRKKQQPNFFVPQQEIAGQAEKLQMPKTANYKNGRETITHVTSEGPRPTSNDPVQRPLPNKLSPAKTKRLPAEDTDMPDIPENDIEDEPSYQKKYQDYLEDLADIATEGKVNDTQNVYDDLNLMNSEQMIEVDKNFNKKREKPQAQLNKALNKALR